MGAVPKLSLVGETFPAPYLTHSGRASAPGIHNKSWFGATTTTSTATTTITNTTTTTTHRKTTPTRICPTPSQTAPMNQHQ